MRSKRVDVRMAKRRIEVEDSRIAEQYANAVDMLIECVEASLATRRLVAAISELPVALCALYAPESRK